jgi:hypothetical protein
MLKGNLSTRPFYNERLIGLLIALVAVAGLALAAFNTMQLVSLSQRRGALKAEIERNDAEAGRISREAAALRAQVDVKGLRLLAASTHEANQLIDQRTFSWTAFFGQVEKTLPLDAYLVGVSPRIEKGDIKVRMLVVSKTSEDAYTFVKALETDGIFYDTLPVQSRQNDDGTYTTEIQASYLAPRSAKPSTPVEPAKAGGKGRP